ncbi:Sec-independent protein translocase subunit TatA [Mangrovihabitans endophyticus]|uniref:Sec-independent protein translocase protein TatA n=1 Tax=Mangrovihabitans endophyticus TaxID=1751298 RepID=A0A8J3C3T3_9ACTN|nr:Sec-independent protein translocase subunit TatA [Mangrovihabitans endophyticus]GGL04025.1 Sec-independent protein translocase protein TatA [Mangrovihabitans endophyticus]
MGALKPWHIIVVLVLLVLLFGAKRLPDAARSLGRSLRIIKAETKGLVDGDDDVAEKAEPRYSRQPLQGEVRDPGYRQAPPPGDYRDEQPQQPYGDPVRRNER